MEKQKPGPKPGSAGANKIAELHRGSKKHDETGGFASNPQLAKEAGKKGGDAVKRKYGSEFYREMGVKGGNVVKEKRGSAFFSEIGRRGGIVRAQHIKAKKDG